MARIYNNKLCQILATYLSWDFLILFTVNLGSIPRDTASELQTPKSEIFFLNLCDMRHLFSITPIKHNGINKQIEQGIGH